MRKNMSFVISTMFEDDKLFFKLSGNFVVP